MTVREASGKDQELVLRRWARLRWELDDPDETPEREAAVLDLIGPVPVPTPSLINLDSDGSVCDVPAVLTERLPGGPPGEPDDLDSFVKQLAEALPPIHAVGEAPSEIPPYRRYHDDLDAIEPPPWAQ
ncbi:MAG: phosphotransferase, partial [Actinomycetota bacterium]|nr:phosphotransferase [Actinomycetota bacterium]